MRKPKVNRTKVKRAAYFKTIRAEIVVQKDLHYLGFRVWLNRYGKSVEPWIVMFDAQISDYTNLEPIIFDLLG